MHKSHNVTQLMYRMIFSTKYRLSIIDAKVEKVLRESCYKIEKGYEIKFIEIGMEHDHVHFLIQAAPTFSVAKLVQLIKSLSTRDILHECPHIEGYMKNNAFWTEGYFANTVGKFGNQGLISNYVKLQAEKGKAKKDMFILSKNFDPNIFLKKKELDGHAASEQTEDLV